jgi:hypothetical protein
MLGIDKRTEEIKITPEMMEAGISRYWILREADVDPAYTVAEVYRAMSGALKECAPSR